MSIIIRCKCGQGFQAQDRLAGKTVKCPACGGPISVPASSAASDASSRAAPTSRSTKKLGAAAQSPTREKTTQKTPRQKKAAAKSPSLGVRCQCGKGFQAPPQLAGKRVKCPACGAALLIPSADQDADPLAHPSLDPLARQAGSPSPLESKTLSSSSSLKKKNPEINVALIAGIGGGAAVLLLVLIVVIVISLSGGDSSSKRTNRASVASAKPNASTPLAAPSAAAPSAAAPDDSPAHDRPQRNPPPETSPSNPRPSAQGDVDGRRVITPKDDSPSPQPTAEEPLVIDASYAGTFEASHKKWWAQGGRLQGIPRYDPQKIPSYQYSWMYELLPFLGYQNLHDKFDVSAPWSDPKNLQLAGYAIPEFLNPGDERTHAKGYPFNNFGLTHFVGMSGVEDQRNVVAAKLPRSDPRAGIFGYNEIAPPSEITDGLSHTIMVIGAGELASPWLLGGGSTIRGARRPHFEKIGGFGTRGLKQQGAVVLLADGSTRTISADISPEVLEAMCTMHGAEKIDLSQLGPRLPRLPTLLMKPEDRPKLGQ